MIKGILIMEYSMSAIKYKFNNNNNKYIIIIIIIIVISIRDVIVMKMS